MPAGLVHSTHNAIQMGLLDGSTLGYVASALVLATFGMKDMVNLRIIAMCSNVAFITYGISVNLLPILILHVVLLPLNGWRLMGALRQRSARAVGQPSRTAKPSQSGAH